MKNSVLLLILPLFCSMSFAEPMQVSARQKLPVYGSESFSFSHSYQDSAGQYQSVPFYAKYFMLGSSGRTRQREELYMAFENREDGTFNVIDLGVKRREIGASFMLGKCQFLAESLDLGDRNPIFIVSELKQSSKNKDSIQIDFYMLTDLKPGQEEDLFSKVCTRTETPALVKEVLPNAKPFLTFK